MANNNTRQGPTGRIQSMEKIRQRQQQRKEEPSVREQLQEMDQSCMELLQHPASISPYLVDQDLVAHGDYQQIENHAKILGRDIEDFKHQLDGIRATVPADLDSQDPEDIRKGLEIGEWYQDWIDRFTRTVLPIVRDLTQLLQKAAEQRDQHNNVTNNDQPESDSTGDNTVQSESTDE